MNVRVSADSTCDLSQEILEQYDIGIVPLYIILGEKTCRDGIDCTKQDLYDFAEKTGRLGSTAAVPIADYYEYFRQRLETCDQLVHFTISSDMSACYQNACAAGAMLDGRVFVVDARNLSTGIGHLAMDAVELARAGKDGGEIQAVLNEKKAKLNVSFVLDTLKYLYKGGRCSTLSYYGAKVLSIHPMIDMKEGQLYPKKKYMGKMARCIRSYVNDLAAAYPNYDRTRCFVTHSCADAELVELAKSMVRELFRFDTIIETVAGSIITSHCGRNTLGVLFISE